MSNYEKIGIARPPFPNAHPFKIDILKDGVKADGSAQYSLAVNYHSGLFRFVGDNFERINITGLDFLKKVPASFPGKNFYCVLKILIVNSKFTAKIEWVESDQSEDDLAPIKTEQLDDQQKKQTEARVIIGVLVADDEVIAGLPGNESAVNTPYILQYINTNLLLTDFCINGFPITYPTPISGGRLNF